MSTPHRLSVVAFQLVLLLALFWSNFRTSPSGDNLATRALAAAIAVDGSFDISRALGGGQADGRLPYSAVRAQSRVLPAFPLGTGILATPVYSCARAACGGSSATLSLNDSLEKGAASLIAAFSIVLLLQLLPGHVGSGSTIAAASLLAAGTPFLTSLSQGLWSFTGEQLAIVGMIFAVWRRREGWEAPWIAGLLMGIAFLCRPTAILSAPVTLSLLKKNKSRLVFLLTSALGVLAVVLVNLRLYGTVLGAYGELNSGKSVHDVGGLFLGLAGVVLSPSRGLVWFFPALILALACGLARRTSSRFRLEYLGIASTSGLVLLLTASYEKWWGGHSIGPRLLSELAVPTALALAFALDDCRTLRARRALVAVAGFQSIIFLILHFSVSATTWSDDVAVDANPAVLWSIRDSQLAAALVPGWKYEETGAYFDPEVIRASRGDLRWQSIDLGAAVNARYDLPASDLGNSEAGREIYLPRLAHQAVPANAHLRILAPGADNVVRTCRGERSTWIPAGDAAVRKLDTLILWRAGSSGEVPSNAAGWMDIEFAGGKVSRLPLSFRSRILLRQQLDLAYAGPEGRFYGGSVSAPDAIQRQRFTIPGKNRYLSRIAVEIPEEGPDGCLFLLAASAGI